MTKPVTPSKIRIYGFSPYDRGAKARWLLTELGLEFESRWLNREQKEHESPDFLRLNPMGRVPVMEFGEQVIFESGAICAYLCDRFPDRELAPLPTSPDRAAYQQWMYFAAATLDAFQTRIMIIEDIPPGELHDSKEIPLLAEFRDALGVLDDVLAKKPFLLGNYFSVVDICVAHPLYGCTFWPEFDRVMQSFPRVMSYLKKLKNMPSAVKANVFSYEG